MGSVRRRVVLRCLLLAAALWCVLPARVAWAAQHSYNINPGSDTVHCTQAGDEYVIWGTGSGYAVGVSGGSEANPIYVTLEGLTVENGSGGHSHAPLQVESGYCVIRLRGSNRLVGGWHDISFAKDEGIAGLRVLPGATCVITSAEGDGSSEGALYAACSHDDHAAAGIGSNYNEDTGTIIIRGGTIEAHGGHCGAGIGSGRDGVCNTVSIEGGTVKAYGGEYAAGIGGGDAVGTGSGGSTRHLYISGGTVEAHGGNNGGAGIGGSEGGSVDGIHITGGTITATGGGSAGSAAGIGSGDGAGCGNIEIAQASGSTLSITATGYGEGAGIGGANCKSGTISIALAGGSVTATGGPEAAGIGSGDDESGSISLSGHGTIEAHAGAKSAAIGAGDQGHSGAITIAGAADSRLVINAYAPQESGLTYAAIIGAGDGSAADISISNANITLYAPAGGTLLGAGIGSGSSNDLSLKDGGIGTVSLANSTVRFGSIHKMIGAGIGAGYGSNIKTITLNGVDYEGPTIGSSCSDRFATDENSMDSITITGSTVKATARDDEEKHRPWAGIGTGPFGSIGSITIENSNVEARGVNGGAGIGSGGLYVNTGQLIHSLTSSEGKCGSVTISGASGGGYTVKAYGSGGGAGIGAGQLTQVSDPIVITGSGVTVEAHAGDDGGAGIGGGKLCSCNDITISGATVTAQGFAGSDPHNGGAGIGSGSINDDTFISGIVGTAWNTICGTINLQGGCTVTATGGDDSAGIGLGKGAQMRANASIKIKDATVTATGGVRGAGIGAGSECGLGRGGEARRIWIEGQSMVTAQGGAGAAGIGGGYEGGFETLVIKLGVNDPELASVVARGGYGAAGIGAGASSHHSSSKTTLDGAHDAKDLRILNGFVAAYGGAGLESETQPEGRSGAGAGIGGGSYQGDLEGFYVSGGVVVAQRGADASSAPSGTVSAEDIGHGGSREGGDDGSDNIVISGGTVIGAINEREKVTVTVKGGSVRHGFTPGRAQASGTAVYQNSLAVDAQALARVSFEDKTFYRVGTVSTSAEGFGGEDLFALADAGLGSDRARLWLYLPAGAENASTADFKPADVELHYYGTTAAQAPAEWAGPNVLKMGVPLAIVPSKRAAELTEGSPYNVKVMALRGFKPAKDTKAKLTAVDQARFAEDTKVVETPLNTDVSVTPGEAGKTMKLEAELASGAPSPDTQLYWGTKATYEAVIGKELPYVHITNDLNKVYDGQPAAEPECDTNGAVTKVKYTGSCLDANDPSSWVPYGSANEQGAQPPTQIGRYEVTVWAELNGRTVTASQSFQIRPYTIVLDLVAQSKVADGTPAQVTCTPHADETDEPAVAFDDGSAPGTVTYVYYQKDAEGDWTQLGAAPTEVGDYGVVATGSGNPYYREATAKAAFSITEQKPEPFLLVAMPQTVVYDAQPVEDPLVWSYPEAEPQLSYYRAGTGDSWEPLASAPRDAGSYKVVASVAETASYAAKSAEAPFTILPRPATLSIAEAGAAGSSSATLSVTLHNGLSDVIEKQEKVDLSVSIKTASSVSGQSLMPQLDPVGAALAGLLSPLWNAPGRDLTPQAMDWDRTVSAQATFASANASGEPVATHTFPQVGAGEYLVTASFTDPNYDVKPASAHYDKAEPVDPVGPVTPVTPVTPVSPTTPDTPVSPDAPVTPNSPVSPDAPVSPVTPGPTPVPSTPSSKPSISTSVPTSASGTKLPGTDDAATLLVPVVLVLLGLGVFVLVLVLRRRR